jgi:flagellar biosynthesis/type III secretory pathway M-ring protein FliF/YscJ
VSGLQPKNVVLGDTSGNLLEDAAKSDTSSSAINSQLDAKRSYERGVEQAVTTLLTQTLGPEKAVVRANALMNWDQVDAHVETFSPAGAAPQPRSTKQSQETFSGQGLPPEGGVPGTTTNVPPIYTGAAGGGGPTDYSRQDVTTNFELSKETKKVIPALGSVQRLSVAVMVPDTVAPAQIQSLSSLVAAAAGIDIARGDTVSVAALPLDTSKAEAADQAARDQAQHELEMTGVKIGGALAAILLFFVGMRFIGGGVGRRGTPSTVVMEGQPGAGPLPAIPGLEDLTAVPGAAGGAVPATTAPLELPMSTEEQRRIEEERMRQERDARMSEMRSTQLGQLQELAKTDPQRVAEVLQIWLAEDRRGGR